MAKEKMPASLLDACIDDIAKTNDASETEDEAHESQKDQSLGASERVAGEKLVWSTDEGLAFVRKSGKRKRETKDPKATKRVAKRVTSLVESDEEEQKAGSKPNRKSRGKKQGLHDKEDDNLVPFHVLKRRDGFRAACKRLGDAGLKLPPSFDDIYFSDNDNDNLREKPFFPTSEPTHDKSDIVLETSGGSIPAPIAQWLRDYQVEGTEFLHKHFVYQEGCLLGDDMGLGKTIQVIAFLTAAFGKTADQRDNKRMRKIRQDPDTWYPRVLIVCPGTLIANWRSELDRWGWWKIYTYHGGKQEREDALLAAKSGRAEIVITTYSTYRRHSEQLNFIDWDCVVADECHQIRDNSSDIAKAMNNINALCRIGLTGTAIQNNYSELWTLLNWTNPGRFGSLPSWGRGISNPLRVGQAHDATVNQLAVARRTAQKLVKNLLPPFFLRRMKSLIADQLPKKSDRVVFCPLTETQGSAYQNLVRSEEVESLRTAFDRCECGSGSVRSECCHLFEWQRKFFPFLIALTKLANHLALIVPTGTDEREKQEKDLELLRLAAPASWKELYRTKDNIQHFANQEFCGKWKILKKLLEYWFHNGDKVLVFSHSVKLLKMLDMLLKSTTVYSASYLDGSMTYEERAAAVDDFNSNPNQFVFLISTKAGGVGLNITSANKVVIVDPHWNPAYDLQAQDRAYRIGQTRNVEVFRLISAGTIEEIVYARQIYKQQQANIGYKASSERRYFKGIQNKKKGEIFGLKNLLDYKQDRMVLREIVNETNVAENRTGVLVADIDLGSQELDFLGDEAFRPDDTSLNGNGLSAVESPPSDAFDDFLASQTSEGSKSGLPLKKKTGSGGSRAATANGINYILAQAGVSYTHENSEVIGTSKVEAKLSRQAMQRGTEDLQANDERVFVRSASQPTSSQPTSPFHAPKAKATFHIQNSDKTRSFDASPPLDLPEELDSAFVKSNGGTAEIVKSVKLKYRPPPEVRVRQLVSLAKHFGYASTTVFALEVEKWSQEKRRECLERFYTVRRKTLLAEMVREEGDV